MYVYYNSFFFTLNEYIYMICIILLKLKFNMGKKNKADAPKPNIIEIFDN